MKMRNTILTLAAAALFAGACSRGGGGGVKLASEADSVAYILGLNIGENLLRMDSALNVGAVALGIGDYFAGRVRLTPAEAQAYYLRYVNHAVPEQLRAQESQWLDDLTRNTPFKRSESGLRYEITAPGDEADRPAHDDEVMVMRCRIVDRAGREVYASPDTLRLPLGGLTKGLQEGLKLLGKGGSAKLWVPFAAAYGGEGNAALGVEPNQTLYYEVELFDILRSRDGKAPDVPLSETAL